MPELEIEYYDSFSYDVYSIVRNTENRALFGKGGFIEGSCLYLPIACSNAVLKYDMELGGTELIRPDCDFDGIYTMCRDGDTIYMSGIGDSSGRIIYTDSSFMHCKEINLPCIERNKYTVAFFEPIIGDRSVFLFPEAEKHIYEIDRVNKKVRICTELEDFIITNEVNHSLSMIQGVGKCLNDVAAVMASGKIYRYNDKDKERREEVLYYNDNDIRIAALKMKSVHIGKNESIDESIYSLPFLIRTLSVKNET